MEIEPSNIKLFVKIMKSFKNLDTITVTVNQDCLELNQIDPNKCYIVKLKIGKSNFDKYNVEEDCEFTVDIKYLNKILSDASDNLCLKIKDNKLLVKINKTTHKISLLDTIIDTSTISTKGLVMTSGFTISSSLLQEICNKIYENVEIKITKELVSLECTKDENSSVTEYDDLEHYWKKDLEEKYEIKHITKFSKLADYVEFKFIENGMMIMRLGFEKEYRLFVFVTSIVKNL